MAILTIADQVALGIDRLATIWKDKPTVNGLLQAYLESVQEVENVYFDLLENRSLDAAIGAQLDVIGLIVGQLRGGEMDDAYRDSIKLRIAINNSDGTEPTISSLLQQLSGATSIIFEPIHPATIRVTLVDILETLPAAILADIEDVVAAGVRLDLVHGPGSVEFSASNYAVNEDGISIIVTINRNSGSIGAISGTVQLVPDPPAVGGDFSGEPYTFSMADGITSDTVTIGIVDNGIFEGEKTAQLSFINLVNTFASGQTTSQVTITDDELETITSIVSDLNPSVAEGSSYTLTIQRTASTTFPVTVDLTGVDTGGAVEGVDYDNLPATLTIAIGQLSESLIIDMLADPVADPGEFFDLVISNPTVGSIDGGADTATVTITDAPESTVAMTVPSQNVDEGDSVIVSVTRTGSVGACSVNITTEVGSGTADISDFENTSKTVNWANGDASAKTASFTTSEDVEAQGDRTFEANLDTPVGCSISGTSQTIITIVDDDFVSLTGLTEFADVDTSGGEETSTTLVSFASNGEGLSAASLANGTLPLATNYNATDWWTLKPQVGIGSDYEIRATEISFIGPGVAGGSDDLLNTWLSLVSPRSWSNENTKNNAETFSDRVLTIEIRDSATMTVHDSGTYTLTSNTFGP